MRSRAGGADCWAVWQPAERMLRQAGTVGGGVSLGEQGEPPAGSAAPHLPRPPGCGPSATCKCQCHTAREARGTCGWNLPDKRGFWSQQPWVWFSCGLRSVSGALSLAYARPCPSCDQESGCHELFAQSSCRWVVIQKCSSHPHEDPGPWATRDRQEPWGLAQPLSLLGDSALLGVWGDLRAQPFFSFSSLFFSCSLFSSLRGLITAQTFNSDGN